MSTRPEPLNIFRTRVQPTWIDYNGHMNETYYVLIASLATDRLVDLIGMDKIFRQRFKRAIFTLETHVTYLKEVSVDKLVRVETQILALDEKRLRVFHSLIHGDTGECLCTTEMMLLHVDSSIPKAAPFESGPMAKLQEIYEQHKRMPMPSKAGRGIIDLGAKR